MNIRIRAAAAICALAAAALCAVFFIMYGQPSAPAPQAQSASLPGEENAPGEPPVLLFPGLSSMPITSLTISTPERSFQFQLDTQGTVSVNGQQADSEIFSTLIDQISELPVEHYSAFKPQSHNLILTLVVSTGQEKQTARFYEDGGAGEKAHILLGTDDAPEYRQTSGWRVGTLMMTCEGTRIQDAYGNETPAIQ